MSADGQAQCWFLAAADNKLSTYVMNDVVCNRGKLVGKNPIPSN
jgi:hypothetical protein